METQESSEEADKQKSGKQHYKAVIMAGGAGTRLWPLSTKNKPKQFQSLASDNTMLQETYNRLRVMYDPADIYVAINEDHRAHVGEQLPDLPEENIIYETALRDTASAVALICAVIEAHTPSSVVSVFPSDHVIENPEVLESGLRAAQDFIAHNPEHILTFGITPVRPETGYGYIKKAAQIAEFSADKDSIVIYEAEKFVEKPDTATAQQYLDSGEYYWNAGMFVFNVRSMIDKYAAYVPDTHKRLVTIKEVVGTDQFEEVLRREFVEMDKISLDYAIMENADHVALLPIALEWSDVGNWVSLKQTLVEHEASHLSRGDHIDFKSKNVVAYAGDKPVITVGLQDTIVIDTPNATLVCSHAEAANLSKYVKELDGGDYSNLL